MLTVSMTNKPGAPARSALAMTMAAALTLTSGLASVLTLSPVAQASDLDLAITADQDQADDAHFLRLAVMKSAVVKLPAAVKDVIVGNPAMLEVVVKNKNTAYLFGGAVPGQTNVFFFDANGQQILQLDVDVVRDVKGIQKLVQRTLKGSNITVDSTGSNVVLNGNVANAAEAKLAEDLVVKSGVPVENVVNALKINEGDQVMLKVKVVEVQRDVLKKLGVDLQGALSIGNLAAGFATTHTLGGASALGASFANGNFSVDATVDAMEEQGVVRTLAEPTLTAVSGQRAQFLAGGQYPYRVRQCDSGGGGCYWTVTYKDYGVKLGFTPEVMSEGRISLKIATEVSELSGVADGALNTRAAETTVELPSGGAMMLAGLIKDSTAQTVQGTPGLRDLPVLGTLFRSRNFVSGQTELAVIVTPYMVNAVAEKDLVTPDKRFAVTTDKQQILFGRLNKIYGTAGKNPNGVYHGNVGYIIE